MILEYEKGIGRYGIEIWHGEYMSLYHVIDHQTEESDMPNILETFHSLREARVNVMERHERKVG